MNATIKALIETYDLPPELRPTPDDIEEIENKIAGKSEPFPRIPASFIRLANLTDIVLRKALDRINELGTKVDELRDGRARAQDAHATTVHRIYKERDELRDKLRDKLDGANIMIGKLRVEKGELRTRVEQLRAEFENVRKDRDAAIEARDVAISRGLEAIDRANRADIAAGDLRPFRNEFVSFRELTNETLKKLRREDDALRNARKNLRTEFESYRHCVDKGIANLAARISALEHPDDVPEPSVDEEE